MKAFKLKTVRFVSVYGHGAYRMELSSILLFQNANKAMQYLTKCINFAAERIQKESKLKLLIKKG